MNPFFPKLDINEEGVREKKIYVLFIKLLFSLILLLFSFFFKKDFHLLARFYLVLVYICKINKIHCVRFSIKTLCAFAVWILMHADAARFDFICMNLSLSFNAFAVIDTYLCA